MKGAHTVQQSPAKKTPPVRSPQSAGEHLSCCSSSRLIIRLTMGFLFYITESSVITYFYELNKKILVLNDCLNNYVSAGFLGTVSTPSLGVHKMQIGHLMLEVSSGDITKESCDAIINSSNQAFSLKSGKLIS